MLELVGVHVKKGVPEPAVSFWAAGGREEDFFMQGE